MGLKTDTRFVQKAKTNMSEFRILCYKRWWKGTRDTFILGPQINEL